MFIDITRAHPHFSLRREVWIQFPLKILALMCAVFSKDPFMACETLGWILNSSHVKWWIQLVLLVVCDATDVFAHRENMPSYAHGDVFCHPGLETWTWWILWQTQDPHAGWAQESLDLTTVPVMFQKLSARAVSSDGVSPLVTDTTPSRSKQMRGILTSFWIRLNFVNAKTVVILAIKDDSSDLGAKLPPDQHTLFWSLRMTASDMSEDRPDVLFFLWSNRTSHEWKVRRWIGHNQTSWTIPCWSTPFDTTGRQASTTEPCPCVEWSWPRWMPQTSTIDVLCHPDARTTFLQNDPLTTSSHLAQLWWKRTARSHSCWMCNRWCANPLTRPWTCSLGSLQRWCITSPRNWSPMWRWTNMTSKYETCGHKFTSRKRRSRWRLTRLATSPAGLWIKHQSGHIFILWVLKLATDDPSLACQPRCWTVCLFFVSRHWSSIRILCWFLLVARLSGLTQWQNQNVFDGSWLRHDGIMTAATVTSNEWRVDAWLRTILA